MFSDNFDKYACFGETIETVQDGFTITARIEQDQDMGPPWKEHDGHGPVSEWTHRDIEEGERILSSDRYAHRFYDWDRAKQQAISEEWGWLPDELQLQHNEGGGGTATAGLYTATDPEDINRAICSVYRQHRESMSPDEYAEGAVARDFEYLRRWCNDEWHWCGVVLSVSRGGVVLDEHAASLWGIELNAGTDNDFLTEVANELLDEALQAGKSAMARLHAGNCETCETA